MTRGRPVVLAAVVLLAACSADSGSSSESTAAEVAADSTVAATVSTEVPATTPTLPEAVIEISTPPGAPDAVGALDDVEGLECAPADGRWTASGDVVNSTSTAVRYRIYVSFLDPAGETVGLIETDVNDVVAGARASWSAGFDSDTADVRCVLRVERFTG
jgi:hypothetical protein